MAKCTDYKAFTLGTEWFANVANAMPQSHIINTKFENVETDSRSCNSSSLFVALKGEKTDGHNYVYDVINNDCRAVLVNESWFCKQSPEKFKSASIIVVKDTLAALQSAAKAYRELFVNLIRIGVTGSSGKTGLKELIALIMGQYKEVVKTPGNKNSDIGLASSMFLIRAFHEMAVFEMGINRPHEMEELASMYEPSCAVINNIGTAHIGVLGGSREDIAREKKAIASHFNGKQNLVIWEDDDFYNYLSNDIDGNVISFGTRTTQGYEGCTNLGVDGWLINYCGAKIHLHSVGKHNLLNALAAITVARLYGASVDSIVKGLELARPVQGRSNIINGVYTVIDDTYNANTESTLAAIEFCNTLPKKNACKLVFVLGSMKELGDECESSHRRVGAAASKSNADAVFFYGTETKSAFDEASLDESSLDETLLGGASSKKDFRYFTDYTKLESSVLDIISPGDIVLVKASRSMELERIVNKIIGLGENHVS